MADQKKAEQDGSVGVNEFMNSMADAIKSAMQQGVQAVNPRRDNPNPIPDSERAPAGVEKEPLTRRVIFKGIVQEDQQITPEEAHLFNLLQPVHKILVCAGLPREFTVRQENKGSVPDLIIDFPLSIEERAYMPSLVKILKALIDPAITVIE